mgnify:CR=1 FL=1
MNRVTKRTWMMAVFVVLLLGGMLFFAGEYALKADQWVVSTGSPHVYNNSNLGNGTVVDRDGNVLLDISDGRHYSDNAETRASTMHWLGDRKGSIQAKAVANYAALLAGYDKVDGLYDYAGSTGVEKLTLSASVQNTAVRAVYGRKWTVGVFNFKTGELLCAVTSPTYDPDNVPDIAGDTTGAYEGVYLNRFLQSTYVPGSIFKIVTTAAALECVPDIESRTFYCDGAYEYGTEAVTCETAHGTLDLKGALAHSCNCSFAQIAQLVGRKNMEKYVAKYGITDAVSFDGVTSAKGNYDIADTGGASFAWSCIGQHSDLINPCRFMVYMGQIAGGGVAAMPYIVSRVESSGEITYQAKTTYTDRIMSQTLAQKVQQYMRNNVEVTFGSYKFPGLTVCGKSGTAELGEGQISNAMFSGFCTDEQYPLAFVVAVENGGYGAAACVPILSVVLSECKAVMDAF